MSVEQRTLKVATDPNYKCHLIQSGDIHATTKEGSKTSPFSVVAKCGKKHNRDRLRSIEEPGTDSNGNTYYTITMHLAL